jgi:membrane associated rhomboid family serine protease
MARRPEWQDKFSFGGRLPWAVGLVLVLTVSLSLLVAFGSRHTAPLHGYLSLRPAGVLNGELWRLASWPFLEPSPLYLILSCLFIGWFGSDLANIWGSRLFLAVFASTMLAAGIGTSLLGLVDHDVYTQEYVGGYALCAAITVAWGLFFPDRVVRIYFVLPIRGFWLAWLTIAWTVVYAVYAGWEHQLPELLAEGSTLGWMYRGWFKVKWRARRKAKEVETRFRDVRDRTAKRKASVGYLRLVEKEDDDPPPMPKEVEDRVSDLLRGAPPSRRGEKEGEED